MDQFAGKGFWSLDCKYKSKNCRGIVVGDIFTLPKETQLKYYRNLPPSIIEIYNEQFRELENLKKKSS